MSGTDPLAAGDRCVFRFCGETEDAFNVALSAFLLHGEWSQVRWFGRVERVVQPDGWGPRMSSGPDRVVPVHYFVQWDGCNTLAGGYTREELWRVEGRAGNRDRARQGPGRAAPADGAAGPSSYCRRRPLLGHPHA